MNQIQTTTTDNAATKVPEKFIDPETGELNSDALLQSYMALERKMSAQSRPPASADEYCVDCSHGLFDVDPDINEKLYEKGFTIDQVQAVYDLAAEKFVPMILELTEEFRADREVERLVEAFGGAEKWQEVSRQLLAYGKKNLPPQALQTLAGSFEGVMALYRMMKGQEPGSAIIGDAETTTGMSDDDIKAMMRDPRYWRDKDPAFVSKVTEGFKKIYQS